tara:strand:+ start:2587 stop:2766 length:180 start_codon:yes stop_codon:yes gene_type:complete
MGIENGDLLIAKDRDSRFKNYYGFTKQEYFEAMVLQGFCSLNSRNAVERAERSIKELDK